MSNSDPLSRAANRASDRPFFVAFALKQYRQENAISEADLVS